MDPEGKEVTIACDTIALANMAPNKELAGDGKGKVYAKGEVYTIGDAIATRRANGAIHDAYRLAMTF